MADIKCSIPKVGDTYRRTYSGKSGEPTYLVEVVSVEFKGLNRARGRIKYLEGPHQNRELDVCYGVWWESDFQNHTFRTTVI